MPIYVQIGFDEERMLKKAVLEARAITVSSQNIAFNLVKMRKDKIAAMVGTASLLKEMEREIEKIKHALPQLEPELEEKPQVKQQHTAKTKATKTTKAKKTKYEQELEKIKEKISKL